MDVSLIICTYNGAKRIKWVCESLNNLIVPKETRVEVILVDNNSTDNVSEIFKNNINLEYQYIREQNQGLSFARRAGIIAAKYPIICFIDDDNYVANDWLMRIKETFIDESIGAIGGKGIFTSDIDEIPLWFYSIARAYAVGDQGKHHLQEVKGLYGAGITIRKSLIYSLVENEGFLVGRKGDTILSGEDYEMCEIIKLNKKKLIYNKNMNFFHYIDKEKINTLTLDKMLKSFGIAFIELLPYRGITDYKIIPTSILSSKYLVLSLLNFGLILSLAKKDKFKEKIIRSAIKHLKEKRNYNSMFRTRRAHILEKFLITHK